MTRCAVRGVRWMRCGRLVILRGATYARLTCAGEKRCSTSDGHGSICWGSLCCSPRPTTQSVALAQSGSPLIPGVPRRQQPALRMGVHGEFGAAFGGSVAMGGGSLALRLRPVTWFALDLGVGYYAAANSAGRRSSPHETADFTRCACTNVLLRPDSVARAAFSCSAREVADEREGDIAARVPARHSPSGPATRENSAWPAWRRRQARSFGLPSRRKPRHTREMRLVGAVAFLAVLQ